MKRHITKLILVVLSVALLFGTFTACSSSPATPTSSSFTITDYKDKLITIKNNHPQRIVSLSPSNTEILFALGLGDRVVGVSDYSNYPPEAATKQSVGAYNNPDIETIVSLEPDLVLANTGQADSIYQELENKGLTVVAIIPKNVKEVLESITLIGKITGQDQEAAALVSNLQQRIDAITNQTSKLTEAEKPRVCYIIWHDPIWTTGNGTFEDSLIQMAGGVNIAHDLNSYVDINLETVIDANPQIMIAGVGMGTGADLTYQFIQNEPRLANTDARINRKIYSVDMDIVARPGPRIVDALEEFFRLIHPELQ
jgi:iron complex transport system substrate-binding protein